MITASEFLMWCEVFHVATGGNPPTTVSLQVAYDNSSPKQIDISANNLNIIDGIFGIDVLSFNSHASFQVDSTTAGTLPFPRMEHADEVALESLLSTTDKGLSVFNTDFNTLDIYSGSAFQQVLTIQNVVAGANVGVTNNNDGTVTISAISGPSAVSSGQASFTTTNNTTTSTMFGGTGLATPVLVNALSAVNQTNFAVTLSSGTPNVQFLTAATRRCEIKAVLTLKTSSALPQTYSVYLSVVNGMVTTTTAAIGSVTIDSNITPGPQEISLNYNLALSGPGDNLQFLISNDSATTDPVFVVTMSVTILDTTQFGGFSSTDNLPEGMINKYLSIDSGTTLNSASGTIVSGNIPRFSGTSGLIIDSGVSSYGNSALTGNNSAITFPASTLGDGNYFKIGNNYIGSYGVTNKTLFSSYNLSYNPTTVSYQYSATGPNGFAIELAPTGIFFKKVLPGTAGTDATLTTAMSLNVAGVINIPGLAASEAVVTDGSNNLVSLVYTNANTASTIVSRDASGNFSAGTITADLNGNATTSSIAVDANNIATLQNSTNASFYPLFVSSTTNSYQTVNLNSGFSFNPSTGILTSLGYIGNSLTSLSGTDLTLTSQLPSTNVNANNINITASNGNGSGSSNGGGINITAGNGSGASGANGGNITVTSGNATSGSIAGSLTLVAGISTTTGGSASLSAGDGSGGSANGGSLNLTGGSCTGLGGGGNVSLTGGAAGSSGTGGFVTISGGNSGTSSTAGNLRLRGGLATTGTQGSVVFDRGNVNFSLLTASTFLALDGSKNVVSQVAYGITSFATVTASTQSMSLGGRYVNNYSGGQCVYSLPAATGSGRVIELLSLSTASTSGWKVNANGSDVIEYGSSVSSAGGSIASTVGSATDCATFVDSASGKWIVCPALGTFLVVT